MSHFAHRFKGELPKIGIRPAIDGRREGIREALEDQTMGMARNLAAFLTEKLRYPSGSPVECVIADSCIGGIAEAAQAAAKFAQTGVGLTITVTPCWCYGSETMDMDPLLPKAVWGFNGTERPGAVYLAAVLAAHAQKGIPAFGIYGHDVQDADDFSIPEDVQQKLLSFARAGLAVALMRGRSYLGMGGMSMGIAGSLVNPDFLENYLGMRYEMVDMTEFARRIDKGIFDKAEYDQALAWVKENCIEGMDPNPPQAKPSAAEKERYWEMAVKTTLVARDMMVGNPQLETIGYGEEALGHNALAAGFQGQRQWTDHFANTDFMEAILNSSFDWNGTRQPFIVATENDCLNAISMLFGHLLTGTAQIFADVRTYWSPTAVARVTGHRLSGRAAEGVIHLINSGPAALDGTGQQEISGNPAIKPFWDVTKEDVKNCLEATRFCPAILDTFRGGGFSTTFVTRGGMPVTMARLNLIKGLGPVLQIAEGYTVDLPSAVAETILQRTNPTWPTTWFAPRLTDQAPFTDVYSVMKHWGANHGSLSYGHIGSGLITLAAMLRIPVSMHNIDPPRIFRPKVWDEFGATDLQGADYRACSTYGPLYR